MTREVPEPIRLPNPPWFLRLLSLKIVIPTTLTLLLVLAPFVVRAWHLALMPRVEEPIDRAELESLKIPEEENAFTHYRRAASLAVPASDAVIATRDAVSDHGWNFATPELERHLQAFEPALAEYRAGAKLSQAQAEPVAERNPFAPARPGLDEMREYARNVVALVRRHEARGEMREAGELLIDLCRTSRLAGQNGGFSERTTGIVLFAVCAAQFERWSSAPELTSADLRRVIAEIQAAWRLTERNSRNLEIECYTMLRTVEQLESGTGPVTWEELFTEGEGNPFRIFLGGEPELGTRLLRFQFANLIRFADLPAWQRPPWDSAGQVFDDPTGLSIGGYILPVADYERAWRRSPVANVFGGSGPYLLETIDRETIHYASSLCLLAVQAYYRDHGRFPARLEDLTPDYLAELPLDPFDGNPIKYRPELKRPAVYSVFKNGIDDGGGLVSPDDEGLGSEGPPDLGYRLLRPPLFAPRPVVE